MSDDKLTSTILQVEESQPLLPGQIELGNLPNPKCKKCHGRGHLGRNIVSLMMVPCKCTNPKRAAQIIV